MKNESYNLMTEKWIAVTNKDNCDVYASIRDIALNGEKYKSFRTPVFHKISFSMYEYLALRLMTGVLFDALTMHNIVEDTKDIFIIANEGGYSDEAKEAIAEYLDTYESRFNLFDEEHPFFQAGTSDLEKLGAGKKFKSSIDNMLKCNPLAPAASSRLSEIKEDAKNLLMLEGEKGDVISQKNGRALSCYSAGICLHPSLP